MCGSNFYGSDLIPSMTSSQTARAAHMIYNMLQFRREIEHQKLKPIMVQGLVPLCSWQYERLFNTARIPGIESDRIVHRDEIKHIVVLHNGRYFKMMINHWNRFLNPRELQVQLNMIVDNSLKTSETEDRLASLTALNRTKWAEIREKYFSEGINKKSLDLIESAAFVVSLDDEPFVFEYDSSPEEYGYYGRQLLHGNGKNRWFDKSFNLCVGTNGKVEFLELFVTFFFNNFNFLTLEWT